MATGMKETTPSRPKEIGAGYGQSDFQSSLGAAAGDTQNKAGELFDAARDVAAQAKDRIVEQAKEQMQGGTRAGADYLDGLAGALDRMAGEFDQSIPFAGPWMRTASRQMGDVAKTIRDGDPQELGRQAQDFARRQPTLCFGLAMVAGFGLVRMFKAAGPSSESSDAPAQRA